MTWHLLTKYSLPYSVLKHIGSLVRMYICIFQRNTYLHVYLYIFCGRHEERNEFLKYFPFKPNPGGDSGKVHSTVKQRWLDNDPALVSGMAALASYADQAVESLRAGDSRTLALLAAKNFAMRRQLYGMVFIPCFYSYLVCHDVDVYMHSKCMFELLYVCTWMFIAGNVCVCFCCRRCSRRNSQHQHGRAGR